VRNGHARWFERLLSELQFELWINIWLNLVLVVPLVPAGIAWPVVRRADALPISLAVSQRKRIEKEGMLWNSVLASTGQPCDMR